MRTHAILAFACLCALSGALIGAHGLRAAPDPEATSGTPASEATEAEVDRVVDSFRRRTWHWQRIMGRRPTRTLRPEPPEPDVRIEAWRREAARARWLAQHPPHRRAWLCIKRYEARWNDPNPPYFGGLQMDLRFQQRYARVLLARKGTADHWTPLEQMWAAEKAHRSGRGFLPWPNTARACGLL